MAELTVTESLPFPIDRQDLHNLWSTAVLGTFPKGELQPELFTMDIGSSLSDATSVPQPGHHFWSKIEALMYVFHDEVDNTGVSLWLAIGPDRFDVACLAAGPLGGGATVRPLWDRWVQAFTGASNRPERQYAIGTVPAHVEIVASSLFYAVTAGTTPSGSWVPVSIDGIVFGAFMGDLESDRWIRVQDGTAGRIQKTESGGGPGPAHDDVIGFGLNTVLGNPNLFFPRFLWTGPRVYRALD